MARQIVEGSGSFPLKATAQAVYPELCRSAMNYYFTASGCMSERIRDRYEKTSRPRQLYREDGCKWSSNLLAFYPFLVFSLRCLMREFVAAGGELIIHGALQPKNSPTPDLTVIPQMAIF